MKILLTVLLLAGCTTPLVEQTVHLNSGNARDYEDDRVDRSEEKRIESDDEEEIGIGIGVE